MTGYFHFTRWEIAKEALRLLAFALVGVAFTVFMWMLATDRPCLELSETVERELQLQERPLETQERLLEVEIFEGIPWELWIITPEQLEDLPGEVAP